MPGSLVLLCAVSEERQVECVLSSHSTRSTRNNNGMKGKERTKENERRALVPHLPFHLPLVFCNLHSSSSSLCFVQIQAERNVARDLNKEQSEEE